MNHWLFIWALVASTMAVCFMAISWSFIVQNEKLYREIWLHGIKEWTL